MMQAICLLWRLSLFNKLSTRRYVFAFSLIQKFALRDVNRDLAMWIKMLFFAPKIARDCTDIDVVLRQINQRLRKLKQKVSGCLRTDSGADDFAKLHSIAETAMKNGNSKFNAILAVVQQ